MSSASKAVSARRPSITTKITRRAGFDPGTRATAEVKRSDALRYSGSAICKQTVGAGRDQNDEDYGDGIPHSRKFVYSSN